MMKSGETNPRLYCLGRRPSTLCVVGAIVCGLVLATSSNVHAESDSNETAWSVWSEAVNLIKQNYFEALTDEKITKGAMGEMVKNGTGALAKIEVPETLGNTDLEVKIAFKDFIRKIAALPGPKSTYLEHVERCLYLFCRNQLDGFSYYQTGADTRALADAQPGGVYLQVETSAIHGQRSSGKFYCRPRDGGPAKRAGVVLGDELVSIDDQPLNGLRLTQISMMLRGRVGDSVKLGLRSKSGKTAVVSVKRELLIPERCRVEEEFGDTVLFLPSFGEDTIADVKAALTEIKKGSRLIINLRGNTGGDPQIAVDLAGMLGCGKGDLAYFVFHGQKKSLSSGEDVVTKFGSILIRQDGLTASSAELLIVLLQEAHGKSVVVAGESSFGKAAFQQTDSVQDGRISLTRGFLTTAKGTSWDKKPIQPTLGGG